MTSTKDIGIVKTYLKKLPFDNVDWNVVKKKGYDYFKIPGTAELIKKKEMLRLSLEKVYQLSLILRRKYKDRGLVRTVILIPSNDHFDSQVIAFFDKEICKNWFKRSSRYQKWEKTTKENKLIGKL